MMYVAFFIGLFCGGILGVMTLALVSANDLVVPMTEERRRMLLRDDE